MVVEQMRKDLQPRRGGIMLLKSIVIN